MKCVSYSLSASKFLFIVFISLLQIRHVMSECTPSQWMCDDQTSCIDALDKCDGKINCPDGSDEIVENCFHITICPEFSFQCSYGACIPGRRKCNGVRDCADNSDELFCGKPVAEDLQRNCPTSGEMQCLSSQECINIIDVCDGHADCVDASDESLEVCGNEICPRGFRCAYGACVRSSARCNGTVECHDGSDEVWQMCNYPRKFPQTAKVTMTTTVTTTTTPPAVSEVGSTPGSPPEGLFCEIPVGLSGLNFTLLSSNKPLSPGSVVMDEESLRAECSLMKNNVNDLLCLDGKWRGKFPTCTVFCNRTELLGISTSFVCHRDGVKHEKLCMSSILPYTTVTFYCEHGYRKSKSWTPQISCLESGKFNQQRTPCKMSCGRLRPPSVPLIKNGFPIMVSKSPWHVAIYRNDSGRQTHICGGSIISPRLIVSAAHCFWNSTVPTSPHLYRIAAGKLYSKFAVDEREGSPQIIQVKDIYMHGDYNDIFDQYVADIAIMKLTFPLIYNDNITSVCLSQRTGDSFDYVLSGVPGSITGYGRTGRLERINMATISHGECVKLPDGSLLPGDKFCLVNANLNSTLCRGDSGGGFVEDINGTFHLLGIVSYTPVTQADCVSSEFVGLSNVRYMKTDLYNIMQREKENDEKLL